MQELLGYVVEISVVFHLFIDDLFKLNLAVLLAEEVPEMVVGWRVANLTVQPKGQSLQNAEIQLTIGIAVKIVR
jgi:hypothetical protein